MVKKAITKIRFEYNIKHFGGATHFLYMILYIKLTKFNNYKLTNSDFTKTGKISYFVKLYIVVVSHCIILMLLI